jgi:hypothetical protein
LRELGRRASRMPSAAPATSGARSHEGTLGPVGRLFGVPGRPPNDRPSETPGRRMVQPGRSKRDVQLVHRGHPDGRSQRRQRLKARDRPSSSGHSHPPSERRTPRRRRPARTHLRARDCRFRFSTFLLNGPATWVADRGGDPLAISRIRSLGHPSRPRPASRAFHSSTTMACRSVRPLRPERPAWR